MSLTPVPDDPLLVDRYTVIAFFLDRGWLPYHAFAIAANIEAISGFDAHSKGPKAAFGLVHWTTSFIETFNDLYAKSIYDASAKEQLAFLHWQLTQNDARNDDALKRAGDQLRQTRGASEAGALLGRSLARALNRVAGDAPKRGEVAQRWYNEAIASTQETL